MPRRMIDPEIWRNEKVGNLPDAGRLLFIGIFSNADDDGRLKASAKFLKAIIFPYDSDKTDEQIQKLRDKCAQLGLIRVYGKNGREYLDIPGWEEHQKIRRDRYNPSKLPGYDDGIGNQMPTKCQPSDNQKTTNGDPSIAKFSGVKCSAPEGERHKMLSPQEIEKQKKGDGKPAPAVKPDIKTERGEDTPAKKQRGPPDPRVNEVFAEMKDYLGYPDTVSKDPIPSYGREGRAIKRMLTRGFTCEEVIACWKHKVDMHGGDFVSMTWVNEDIGKKGGGDGVDKKGRRDHWPRQLPKKYTKPPDYDD